MNDVRITKLVDHGKYLTANVTAGGETVEFDTRIGPWTTPAESGSNPDDRTIVRRPALPELAKRLVHRARAERLSPRNPLARKVRTT